MFEFYFQSGEFAADAGGIWTWFSDASVQIIGTLIGGLLALKLYNRQVVDQREKEENKDILKDSDILKYFHFLVTDSITAVNSLASSYLTLEKELSIEFTSSPNLEYSRPHNSLSRISNVVNQNDVYLSYQKLNRKFQFTNDEESISRIFSIVDVLNYTITANEADFLVQSRRIEELHKQYLNAIIDQDRHISYLSIEGLTNQTAIDLVQIKSSHFEIDLKEKIMWRSSGIKRQTQIDKILSNQDVLGQNKELLKPINDLNIIIARNLYDFGLYKNMFKKWSSESASRHKEHVTQLERDYNDFHLFIKNLDEHLAKLNSESKNKKWRRWM